MVSPRVEDKQEYAEGERGTKRHRNREKGRETETERPVACMLIISIPLWCPQESRTNRSMPREKEGQRDIDQRERERNRDRETCGLCDYYIHSCMVSPRGEDRQEDTEDPRSFLKPYSVIRGPAKVKQPHFPGSKGEGLKYDTVSSRRDFNIKLCCQGP